MTLKPFGDKRSPNSASRYLKTSNSIVEDMMSHDGGMVNLYAGLSS